MRLQGLKEKRSHKVADMRAIHDKAKKESRDLDDGERKAFEKMDKKVTSIDAEIRRVERLDQFDRYAAAAEEPQDSEHRSMASRVNVGKAIQEGSEGKLTGVEAEYTQECRRANGQRGGNGMVISVPTELILGGDTRALQTSSDPAGGYLVPTILAPVTDRRRAMLKIEQSGAVVLRGLTGDADMPRMAGGSTASWVGEHESSTRSDITFEKKTMSPKTVTAELEVTRRMLLQSVAALDTIMRADLSYVLAQKLDAAAIRGGATPKEPMGILSDPNVGTVTGGALDSDIAADLIAALETDNVTGTTGFMTNPAVMNVARKTKDADGHVIPVSEIFHNEPVVSSTQVPGDIGAGSNKNALIFGEWASLYLGYWSSIDILINPYHADVASKGGALLHAFLDCDAIVRNPEGFKYAEID